MRVRFMVFVLLWAAAASAKDIPVYVFAGVGGADSWASRTGVFPVGASIIAKTVDPNGPRIELSAGLWLIRRTIEYFDGIESLDKRLSRSDHNVSSSVCAYQAAKLLYRTNTPPDHSPLLEGGFGLGVHEENFGDEPTEFVPRLHFSARFCLTPNRRTSSFGELEVMPRLNEAYYYGNGIIAWVKLGYWWPI